MNKLNLKKENPISKEASTLPKKPEDGSPIAPRKMTVHEENEFIRNEYRRLTKNIENVDYDTLDNDSKYKYILCKDYSNRRPAVERPAQQDVQSQ